VNIRLLLITRNIFYISFIALLLGSLNYMFFGYGFRFDILIELSKIDNIQSFFYFVIELIISVILVFSLMIIFFYMLYDSFTKKKYLQFFTVLFTFYYAWVYYMFFYENGFKLANKLKIMGVGYFKK
jgi:hypothetical protein